MNQIQEIVRQYVPIGLDDLEEAALLKRVDTKFILQTKQLESILQQVVNDYRMLHVKNVSLQSYQTLYFDMPDYQFYFQHHNGKSNRHKIRIRKYIDSDFCCLEVKFKSSAGQTIKSRLSVSDICHDLSLLGKSTDAKNFMQQTFPCNSRLLEPKLLIDFQRITLVNKRDVERVTIDLGLRFSRLEPQYGQDDSSQDAHEKVPSSNESTSRLGLDPRWNTMLANLALVEVKQERFSTRSIFLGQMRAAHINIDPTSFSKYCVGTMLMNPHLKANNFKPILLHAQKATATPRMDVSITHQPIASQSALAHWRSL